MNEPVDQTMSLLTAAAVVVLAIAVLVAGAWLDHWRNNR